MSWFSDLAGKAEALLNQVDQAASDSLKDAGLKTPQKSTEPVSAPYEPTVNTVTKQSPGPNSTSVAQVLVGTTQLPRQHSAGPIHTSTPRKPSPTVVDDQLFEFLNSPSKPKEIRPQTPPAQGRHKKPRNRSIPQTKLSPMLTQPSMNEQVSSAPSVPSNGDPLLVSNESPLEIEATDNGPVVQQQVVMRSLSSDSVAQPEEASCESEQLKQTVSNFELENKLLKREVSSLNEELSSLMSKAHEREGSLDHYQSEVHALREQASRTDQLIRQLRSHDEDLQASLDAKESQVQVLTSQLTDATRKVDEQTRLITALSTEKERFLQDANLSSTAHGHALDSLRIQLKQHQTLMEQEREAHQTKLQDNATRESRLHIELNQARDELLSCQQQLATSQKQCSKLQSDLQSSQLQLSQALREHEDYKTRAGGILQAKEKLISDLQTSDNSSTGLVSETKLKELQYEKQDIQTQLESALGSVEQLRNELQERELSGSNEVLRVMEDLRVCETVLAEERKSRSLTQGELARVMQELDISREDIVREKATNTELIQRHADEMSSLKAQLSVVLSPGRADTETRLHELTESLIQKQTSLETLSAEKHSLSLQLQRVQEQLREAQQSTPQTAVQMSSPDNQDPPNAVRPLTSVLPSLDSSSRLHKVRRAVNSVDKFSIRLGVFLRRYPQARLFTLLYIVLLHGWVMVVLLTYTPEIHDSSDL